MPHNPAPLVFCAHLTRSVCHQQITTPHHSCWVTVQPRPHKSTTVVSLKHMEAAPQPKHHRMKRQSSLLLLLSLALVTTESVEFSSSALMFYNGDLQPDPTLGGLSPCELYVKRAAAHGGRRVQLVPTHYWIDKRAYNQSADACVPDNWLDTDLAVKQYCFKDSWKTSGCLPFNQGAIAAFTAGLSQCFSTALQLFDEVLIAPHLDPLGDTSKRPKWRNMLRFDPLEKDENGYSYWDIMLKPTLDAANRAFKDQPAKTFNFAMEGEMGGTITNHPASYLKIINTIKSSWTALAQLRTGVTFFAAYTTGHINRLPGPMQPLNSQTSGRLEGGFGPLLPFEQWPGVARIKAVQSDLRKLFAAIDFVGISNYARSGPQPTPADMQTTTANVQAELSAMGVDVTPFRTKGSSKQWIWNEFGLGGGIGACNNVSATGPDNLGSFPWLGMSQGEYNTAADPFKQSPEAQAFLQAYYNAALKVLAAGGLSYKVDAAYLWSVASWDVQGIHTASAKWNTAVSQGDWPVKNGFADASVIAAIRAHNKKANA